MGLLLALALLAGLPFETRTAPDHPMRYAVSRPAGWKAGARYPLLVVITDAKREFLANAGEFAAARGDRPFLIVAPWVLTCGGPYRGDPPYPYDAQAWALADKSGDFGFDDDGIAAVVRDVVAKDGAEEKYFLTGWEAGGHTVWALLLRHPERLRGVVPVTTNFRNRWLPEGSISSAPERKTLPVRVLFVGPGPDIPETGRQALLQQTREAMELARAHGFEQVSQRILAEVARHGPRAGDVLDLLELSKPWLAL